MLATTLFFSAGLEIPVIDKKADTYFTESISKAGLAYANSISFINVIFLQLVIGTILAYKSGEFLERLW